jgi:diguanylate cyclase (GGDEF)-like protein
MLQAVLAGVDPRTAGIEIIREATGDPNVSLIDINDPQTGVIVAHEGRQIAKLLGTTSAEVLTPHAMWLGQWLRLDEHLAELRDWAFTDSLTGAWNRRYFEMFLKESMDEARRLRRSLSILMFDIDNFKRWNDENGHAAGDEILVETVKLLKSVIRPTDKVCRIGGDEFAVIFHEPQGPRDPGSHHPDDLSQIATRFQTQIRNKRFPKLSSTHSPLGISGGMATYPWDARTMQELIQVADQRSLQCKRQGKNAIVFGDEGH